MLTNEEVIAKRKARYQLKKDQIREWGKKYREERKQEIQERKRKYYEQNKEKVNEKCRQYHAEHREEANEKRKQQYYENIEEVKRKAAIYRESRREEAKERTRRWREENPERAKETQKNSYLENRDKRISETRAYNKTAAGKAVQRQSYEKQRVDNPAKFLARRLFKQAIRCGRIIRQPCGYPGCNIPNAQGHHKDYSKPYEVEWYCFYHHKLIEGKIVVPREEPQLQAEVKTVGV